MNTLKRQQGFTLVELMVVLIVISILSAMAVPMMVDTFNERRASSMIEEIQQIMSAAQGYRMREEVWADHNNDCADAIDELLAAEDIMALDGTSPHGSEYRTACPETGGERPTFRLRVVVPDVWARIASARIGAAEMDPDEGGVNESELLVVRGLPMAVLAFENVLARVNVPGDSDNEQNSMRTPLRWRRGGGDEGQLGFNPDDDPEVLAHDFVFQGQTRPIDGDSYPARASMMLGGKTEYTNWDDPVRVNNLSTITGLDAIPKPDCPTNMDPAISGIPKRITWNESRTAGGWELEFVDNGGTWTPEITMFDEIGLDPVLDVYTTCVPTGAPGDPYHQPPSD